MNTDFNKIGVVILRTLLGCCLIHLCIGSVYALSVLYTPIMEMTGWGISTLIQGFALTILALGLTASFHQRIFNLFPKKGILQIAIALWIITQNFSLVFIMEGLELLYYLSSIILGIAIGLLYVIPINIVTEYGYVNLGRANGAVVCCFGLGSILASKLFVGIPLQELILLYVVYALIMIIGVSLIECTSIIVIPPGFVRDRNWYILAMIFFLNIGIGISILSNLVHLSVERGLETLDAIWLVALAGIANSVGRLLYATLTDYCSRKTIIDLMLWIQLIALTNVFWFGSDLWSVNILAIISVYGGLFAIMPSLMKELYGTIVAYSQVLSMWGLSGLICPILFSHIGADMLIGMSILTTILISLLKK